MKKFFLTLLAVISVVSFVSCGGGNQKKDEKKPATEQEAPKSSVTSVKDKAVDYCNQMLEAMMSMNEAKVEELNDEMSKWYNTLSDEEAAIADQASDEWEEANAEKLQQIMGF